MRDVRLHLHGTEASQLQCDCGKRAFSFFAKDEAGRPALFAECRACHRTYPVEVSP